MDFCIKTSSKRIPIAYWFLFKCLIWALDGNDRSCKKGSDKVTDRLRLEIEKRRVRFRSSIASKGSNTKNRATAEQTEYDQTEDRSGCNLSEGLREGLSND